MVVLVYLSFRAGEIMTEIKLGSNHTRFAREVFFRLSYCETSKLSQTLAKLSDDFVFPHNYNDEQSTSDTLAVLRRFGLDDKAIPKLRPQGVPADSPHGL